MSSSERELTDEEKLDIRAAIREIDPAQMAIIRRMTAAERAQVALRLIEEEETKVVAELRTKWPQLSVMDALILARGGPVRYVVCQLSSQALGHKEDGLECVERVLPLYGGDVDVSEIERHAREIGALALWHQWQRELALRGVIAIRV